MTHSFQFNIRCLCHQFSDQEEGCGLCLVVPGNEVMIGVKYWVGWALVGLPTPSPSTDIPSIILLVLMSAQKLQHLRYRIWQGLASYC